MLIFLGSSALRSAFVAAALVFLSFPRIASSLPARLAEQPLWYDFETRIDANDVGMYVTNFGSFAFNLTAQDAGLEYPIGSGKACIYASGVWIGAKVNGQTRVTAGCYASEYGPGLIYPNGQWADPSLPEHKVYKIVRGDTSSSDYLSWPSQYGAPADQNGRPLLRGDQMLWCVYNDADPSLHFIDEGSTPPLGIEVQQTAFAYAQHGTLGPLDGTVFMEFKIINKLSNVLDSAYVSLWCDPDIGRAFDDYVGCDIVRNLGFAYNAGDSDGVYGATIPCVGYTLLRGPTGYGGEELGMTSFCKYINGTDPRTYEESYNYMRGLDLWGDSVVDPTTGLVTRYFVPGDPVAGTGWLDANPSDRRFMVSSGPFCMEPGDTQEVALAIIVSQHDERLESVRTAKLYSYLVNTIYDNGFTWPLVPHLLATAADDEVHLAWAFPETTGRQVMIRYSTEAYPRRPDDGLPIPNGHDGIIPVGPGAEVSFVHRDLSTGVTYYYTMFACSDSSDYSVSARAQAITDGSGWYEGEENSGTSHPTEVVLTALKVWPNPANGCITVRYSVAVAGEVAITVHDVSGRCVRRLMAAPQAPGDIETVWDGLTEAGAPAPPGVYFIRVLRQGQALDHKIVYVR